MPTTPPGPRWPAAVQLAAWWTRPIPFFERGRKRFGPRWTQLAPMNPPFVHITDPDEIKQVFTAKPEVLHPGEGAAILEPIVGSFSVILLDEQPHLEQRKLLLPAFHGERMQKLTGLVTEVTEREIAKWPRDTPFAVHEPLQDLTLEIILRAVFGLEAGPRLDRLREQLGHLIGLGTSVTGLIPPLQRDLGPGTPGRTFVRAKAGIDAELRALVDERRAEGDTGREDILAMLLLAEHDDGSPMTFEEIRDELMTALVAGHETTASQLAWTLAMLAREPGALRELMRELDAEESDDYLMATIHEAMRRRPVLPSAEPRLTKQEVTIGDWTYPEGVVLGVNSYLVHHDAAIYPDPYAFRPERFLGVKPGTYTWLPFGGGRRRCLGASFAILEMKVALRTLLRDSTLSPDGTRLEIARRRNITISPKHGAKVTLTAREKRGVAAPAASAGAV
jgi:cytochrome P450